MIGFAPISVVHGAITSLVVFLNVSFGHSVKEWKGRGVVEGGGVGEGGRGGR